MALDWNCNLNNCLPIEFFERLSHYESNHFHDYELQLNQVFDNKESNNNETEEMYLDHDSNKTNNNGSIFLKESRKDNKLLSLKTNRSSINDDSVRKAILQKRNRESAKKSRDKHRNEFHDLLNYNQSLFNQIKDLQSKINLLCPQCQHIFKPQQR